MTKFLAIISILLTFSALSKTPNFDCYVMQMVEEGEYPSIFQTIEYVEENGDIAIYIDLDLKTAASFEPPETSTFVMKKGHYLIMEPGLPDTDYGVAISLTTINEDMTATEDSSFEPSDWTTASGEDHVTLITKGMLISCKRL